MERQPLPGELPEQGVRRETAWLLPPSDLWFSDTAWSGLNPFARGLWSPAPVSATQAWTWVR